MNWQKQCLPNGLRILTIRRPESKLVAIKVCVRAGSRYDDETFGASHLLEHMLMSGTRHQSMLEIHDTIDKLGGEINAQTGKEYIAFHCVVPVSHWVEGLDVLSEILIHPLMDEHILTREKLVILEEIRRSKEQSRIIFSLFAKTLWQRHPLRHPVLGYPKQILSMDLETLIRIYQRRFVTGNMVIAICGDLSHDQVCEQVGNRLMALPHGDESLPSPVSEPLLVRPHLVHLTRKTNQIYLMLGVPTVGMKHPDRSALKIIERVLGMGMSARLYRRLRSELSLVYDVTTATANYEDAGYLAVSTRCQGQNVASVRKVIIEELGAIGRRGVTAEELSKAKTNYAGTLRRRFETNLSIASIAAIEDLLHRVEPFPDGIARVHAVTLEDVQRVASRYLDTDAYVMVTVGPNGPEPSDSDLNSTAF